MSRTAVIETLRRSSPMVLPSMLLCDFGALADQVKRLEQAGASGFHMDVMDGQFVPNMTYGMPIIEAVRAATTLPIDVHLMIADPAAYLDAFISAGSDLITFHAEAVDDPSPILKAAHEQNVAAGIAINPETPLSSIADAVGDCDAVLLMSVKAGFGGQSFQTSVLEKIQTLRNTAGPELLIEVDGGINRETIGDCSASGADLFVVGSAIFKHSDYQAEIRELTSLAVDHEVNKH